MTGRAAEGTRLLAWLNVSLGHPSPLLQGYTIFVIFPIYQWFELSERREALQSSSTTPAPATTSAMPERPLSLLHLSHEQDKHGRDHACV